MMIASFPAFVKHLLPHHLIALFEDLGSFQTNFATIEPYTMELELCKAVLDASIREWQLSLKNVLRFIVQFEHEIYMTSQSDILKAILLYRFQHDKSTSSVILTSMVMVLLKGQFEAFDMLSVFDDLLNAYSHYGEFWFYAVEDSYNRLYLKYLFPCKNTTELGDFMGPMNLVEHADIAYVATGYLNSFVTLIESWNLDLGETLADY